MFTWLKHPSILRYDVAGEVVQVGKDVTRFQVGDRVVGFAIGTDEKLMTQPRVLFRSTWSFDLT
jgi:NADPH:quinone reductase-like Zn-dependent oxidoreductase